MTRGRKGGRHLRRPSLPFTLTQQARMLHSLEPIEPRCSMAGPVQAITYPRVESRCGFLQSVLGLFCNPIVSHDYRLPLATDSRSSMPSHRACPGACPPEKENSS